MIRLIDIDKTYLDSGGRKTVFRGLNLSIEDGENVAVLGSNGAGKSTLLNMIGGIEPPDHGRIETDLTVSWPVGLSNGFQGTLSGRDNVRFVSRVYGDDAAMRAERERFVLDFSELASDFDRPVKSYSSGMRSRLSFGLSMAFDFDVYLVDEVLSVGDARFRDKSMRVFQQKRATAQIILVSHDLQIVRTMCDSAVLIHQGQVQRFASVQAAIRTYQQL